MAQFDPNAAAPHDSGIFGLPFEESEASLVYVPVPWEVTTSYRGGTSEGPQAIVEASRQVDLFDVDVLRPYEAGLFVTPEVSEIREWNSKGKAMASQILESLDSLASRPDLIDLVNSVNQLGENLNRSVYQQTRRLYDLDKMVAVIGGDHSVPFGAIQAAGEKFSNFGILHIDAHSDTRRAFEGFTWSHASIMFNVLENIPAVSKLVQVGIRDLCEEEMDYIRSQKSRARLFLDRDLARKKMEGIPWSKISQEIVDSLPDQVWISFDIDGLDPRFCPHTGTPVPGGMDFHEVNYLFGALVRSGKKIIGFDLCEVAPNLAQKEDDWDANVGARLVYKLSGWMLASRNRAEIQP